jgi:hypothetical protein
LINPSLAVSICECEAQVGHCEFHQQTSFSTDFLDFLCWHHFVVKSCGGDVQRGLRFCEFLNDQFDIRCLGSIAHLNAQTDHQHRPRTVEMETITVDRGDLKFGRLRLDVPPLKNSASSVRFGRRSIFASPDAVSKAAFTEAQTETRRSLIPFGFLK